MLLKYGDNGSKCEFRNARSAFLKFEKLPLCLACLLWWCRGSGLDCGLGDRGNRVPAYPFSDGRHEVKDKGWGQDNREVGDEGREMEIKGREEGEGRTINLEKGVGKWRWGAGRKERGEQLGGKGSEEKRGKVCARAPLQEGRKEVREREGRGLPPCPPIKDVFRCVGVGVGSARKRVLAANDVGNRQQA